MKKEVGYILNKIPVSNNKFIRLHWSVRLKEKEEWKWEILRNRIPKTDKKVKVKIVVYTNRFQDIDNFYASLKPLIDALKEMGVIVDDSERWLNLEAKQIKSKEKFTEIFIYNK